MAQLVQPLAHTSFLAWRCVHAKSARAAAGRTSTVAGAGARGAGSSERAREAGSAARMGPSRRSVKLIWHSTV